MTQPETTSTEKKSVKKSSQKPSRSPVERAIIWVLIVIGVGLVAIEARAKTGYDNTLIYIQDCVDQYNAAGDGENAPELRLAEVKKKASGGPRVSAMRTTDFGEKTLKLKWWSLFKRYELTLVVNNDTDDAIVFNVRPTDPEGE